MTKKILLIDDEPDVTYTITKILEDNRFKVDSFNDPILALNYYKVNAKIGSLKLSTLNPLSSKIFFIVYVTSGSSSTNKIFLVIVKTSLSIKCVSCILTI